MQVSDLRRLFVYDSWANREVIASLSINGSSSRSVKLMAHILGAQEIWYSRIRGQKAVLPVWPELNAQGCQEQEQRLWNLWSNYFDEIESGQLSSSVNYKNTKGEPWTSKIADILLHVVMHSAYHRGQIAADTRAAGRTPAYTDFIHGVRQGLVE